MSALFTRLKRLFDAGETMAWPDPGDYPRFLPAEIRPAAVLIAVTDRPLPGVLFTWRPVTMRQHAGQVAFPGGKLDPGEDAIAAALREAEEELALPADLVRVVGTSARYVTGTGYDITPVLAVVPPDLPLVANPAEVAGWFEAPLGHVLDPANQLRRAREWQGGTRETIEITWDGHLIWGVSAAIIASLSRRLAWHEQDHG